MTKRVIPKLKKSLIKKGAPLPGDPKWKFKDAELKKKEAEKSADEMMIKDQNLATRILAVPRQYLIYGRRYPRITPKMPRLK